MKLAVTCTVDDIVRSIYPLEKKSILDYEIETEDFVESVIQRLKVSWKEKILDYEIETYGTLSVQTNFWDLKREDTRLRDWNAELAACAEGILCSWKEKILDYEIETPKGPSDSRKIVFLKREDTRLRDWNGSAIAGCASRCILEKRRYSITRLKHWDKHSRRHCGDTGQPSWKEKILDYEIETSQSFRWSLRHWHTWKEKILDYEIETKIKVNDRDGTELDLKREDTRLRDWNLIWKSSWRTFTWNLKREDTRLRDWNFAIVGSPFGSGLVSWKEKILDYEIETDTLQYLHYHINAWKEKILDYEIETKSIVAIQVVDSPWKEKILDYEIETKIIRNSYRQKTTWKEKILDYEIETCRLSSETWRLGIAWKEKILDYEIETFYVNPYTWQVYQKLEKRRYSITRLKRWFPYQHL